MWRRVEGLAGGGGGGGGACFSLSSVHTKVSA